ncbi:MAG: hypothetical protein L6R35_004760 [Caloplaca aegaea]|nr:MAG: hypothetical protein L6R35_004760 [Caloplaca aegaea]
MVARNLLLLCLHLFSVAIAQLPPPPASDTDPCGPFDHQGDAGVSTCMSSVSAGGPKPYGVLCGNDTTITIPLKTPPCRIVAQALCFQLATGKLKAGGWHWTPDNVRSPCRAGMLISGADGAAPLPNYERCLNQIYWRMIYSCFTVGSNVGTVNIQGIANYRTNFSGEAVNPGYHAYVISPKAWFYNMEGSAVTPGVFGSPVTGVKGLGDPGSLEAAYNASHGGSD